MTKYEVIEYEVRADPVAKPVAPSTKRFEPRNQPASYLFKREMSRRAILSRIHPGMEPFWERLTMWNTLNLSRAVM